MSIEEGEQRNRKGRTKVRMEKRGKEKKREVE
jgi:hypothetical protein